jgi:nucleotide-binding universal stress UspA family protein
MNRPLQPSRVFLVVVDESPEMTTALNYALHRAMVTHGRVALFRALEPHEISPWRRVEERMDASQHDEALALLQRHESAIEKATGQKPIFYIRDGKTREALLKLLEEEPEISLLVLGAATQDTGPGPLISFLTSAKGTKRLKIPFVVVPENYEIDGGI